jgi:hypothetical protein
MNDCVRRTDCRVCGSTDLVPLLDLGVSPPANSYLRAEQLDEPERHYPLSIHFCTHCSLVQLLHVVDPRVLFEDYHYLTGASTPSVAHFQNYANSVVVPFLDSPRDLVIDIGGNDGVLLSFLTDKARVLNVDPAENLGPMSEERGVPFHAAFFSSETAKELRAAHGPARVITANNVFAHTDPIRDVFAGVASLLDQNGVFIFEVHWVKHLLDNACFDQIYHEHLCYYSLHALTHLVESAGMKIFDVEIVPMQGQSLRVFASVDERPVSERVAAVLGEESRSGVTRVTTWQDFAATVERGKREMVTLLYRIKSEGKRIVGYGAPAKSSTLLNYYGIGRDTLDYIADSTPLKQGLYTPGMHIPIVAPERLTESTPDYVLILAWNFADAILAKEQALRERGVKFILAFPQVTVM